MHEKPIDCSNHFDENDETGFYEKIDNMIESADNDYLENELNDIREKRQTYIGLLESKKWKRNGYKISLSNRDIRNVESSIRYLNELEVKIRNSLLTK